MSHDTDLAGGWQVLGDCPACSRTIPGNRLLATYERDGDWPRMLAECPACAVVVAPR